MKKDLKILRLSVSNEDQMLDLAYMLAPHLPKSGALLIDGTVGSGKTFLCRHLIQAKQQLEINHFEDVPSPTFTLVQTYNFNSLEIWHCDLYRIKNNEELFELGLEEGFQNALCLIEWPDKLKGLKIDGVAHLRINTNSTYSERELHFHSNSSRWKKFSKLFESIKF